MLVACRLLKFRNLFESTTDIIIGDFNAHVGLLPCGSTALDNTDLLPSAYIPRLFAFTAYCLPIVS